MATRLPIIIAKRYGKEYIRSKPEQVKQTPASIKTATSFGKTSSMASQIVATFKPLIGYERQQRIYHRLFSALVNWQHEQQCNPQRPQLNSKYFNGFRFVQQSGLAHVFGVKYDVCYSNTMVVIQLPAFIPKKCMRAPKGCSAVTLHSMVVSCMPFTGEILDSCDVQVTLAYDEMLHQGLQLQMPISLAAESMVLVGIALKYNNIVVGPQAKAAEICWMPSGIVSTFYGFPDIA